MKNKITAGYYVAFIALGLMMSSLGPTLSRLEEQTHSHPSEISILFTARAFGFLVGALVMGQLFDRLPGHRVMAIAICILALTLVFVPLVQALTLLAILMLLIGFFEPGIDVGANTLIVWLHRDKVGPFMNGLHFFFGVGAFISPIIIAWVITTTDGIQWAYWILAVLIFLPALFIIRLPSPTAPPPEDNPENEKGGGRVRWELVGLIAFFFFLYGGAEISFGGWISKYTIAQLSLTESAAALLTSAFWGALTIGRLLSIPIARIWRNRRIISVDLLGCLLSVSIILLWPQSVTAVWLGTIGLGLSMASVFPTTLSLAERHLNVSGQMTSFFFVGASLGGMTVPWIIGQRFEAIGPLQTMTIILGCLLAATAVFGFMMWQIVKEPEVAILTD